MSSNPSPWAIVKRAGVLTGLLMLAGGLMANTLVSSETVTFDPQANYAPADEEGRFTYIVDFVEPSTMMQHRSRSSGQYQRSAPANIAWRSQLQSLQSQRVGQMAQILGRSVSPSHYFLELSNGVALRLTPAEADQLASLDGVESVQRDQIATIDTFRGPTFIGAPALWDGSATPDGSVARGEGMVAAILDSGIPPLPAVHPSFANDPDCGHGVGGAPDKVISALDCTSTDVDGLCNGPDPVDENGHGTHVASTVAGNRVTNSATPSPELPAPFDAVSGVAYCAHIRSYDVCNDPNTNGDPGGSCRFVESRAAMESIIIHTDEDTLGGIPPVSTMNFSIGGGDSPWTDTDRPKLDLLAAGVLTTASAGNGGPTPGDVGHLGPWVMTIASSTHDGRIFDGNVSLGGGPQDVAALEGNGLALGAVYTGQLRWAGDVDAANNFGCDPFPAESFDGNAALIERGVCPFETKVNNAADADAELVIIFTDDRAAINMDVGTATSISAFMISRQPGLDMVAALADATAEVTVDPTAFGAIDPTAGDILSDFSSRGPTSSPLQNLQKPNITAPGDLIYAADLDRSTGVFGFGYKGGTSMSSPHASGAAVLVRQANPDWTPSETKSAIQLTASRDGLKDDGTTPWDWDDVGNGRVDLNNAALAGFVLDETVANYLAANPADDGDVTTLNTADIRNVECSPSCSFTRTIRNTYDVATDWTATVDTFGSNVDIQVTPTTFSFTGDIAETQEITIDVAPLSNMNGAIEFGLILFDEDSDQAPQAHFTTAISGDTESPAAAAVDEIDFTFLLEEGTSGSASFNISNVGEGPIVQDLSYNIDEAAPTSVVLSNDDREADPAQPITLGNDGFAGSVNRIGVGEVSWLWFNQLTPGPLDIPFTLEAVQRVEFPNGEDILIGDEYDIYVWSDPDRLPGSGDEVLLAQQPGNTIGASPALVTIPLTNPVEITAETGDVLIGVVNREIRADHFPANSERSGSYQGRDWIAVGFPGDAPGSPPDLANAGLLGLLGTLNPSLAGNWVIRGLGTGGSACLTPSEVDWLSVAPASGSVAQGESEEVSIEVDTTAQTIIDGGVGTYEARVCVNTNDPNNPVFVLPVTVEVTEVGGLPTIDVAPGTVDASVDVLNPTGSETIDISNTGSDLDLEWSIETAESLAGPARGTSIVEYNDIDFAIPNDFDGGTITWETGDAQAGFEAGIGADLNPFASSGDLGFFWFEDVAEGSGGVASDGTVHDVLQPGDEIGPGSTFITEFGGPAVANFQAGVTGYLGFRFDNEGTPNYGYALFETTGPSGFPATIRSWAFDSSGAPITIPGGGPPPSVCEDPAEISWLSVNPATGTTATGGTDSISVDFDASGLMPGTYEATLCVNSNDPATPLVEVPVSMEVTVPANAAEVAGTVQGLGYCQADPIFAAGAAIEVVGTAGPMESFNLTADANGEYFVFLDEANGPVDVTATAPNHISETQAGIALIGQDTAIVDFGLVVEETCAVVSPSSFSDEFRPGSPAVGNYSMTIDNSLGGVLLEWGIQEASTARVDYTYGLPGGGKVANTTGTSRGDNAVVSERLVDAMPFVDPAPQSAAISANFNEVFDDIALLPGAGWSLQNLSDPLGANDWFQGNPKVFPSHEGDDGAYIAANFNSTGGDGTINSWLMSPEVTLFNGTELTFWTRVVTAPLFADRLLVRLSTSGSSTFAGSNVAEVGDFDTVLLTINDDLELDGYPEDWAQYTVTVEGLSSPTTGRFAFHYFVESGGPSGTDSSYIGIDTVSISQPTVICDSPNDVPWLSVTPFFGSAGIGETDTVDVSVDASALDAGQYEATICVNTNDSVFDVIPVPFSIEVLGDGIFEDRFEG